MILPYSQNRKLGLKNLGKKIPRFPRFPSFWPGLPVLHHKRVKGFKVKEAVQSACEGLDLAETESGNWEYFEDSCSEKIGALFCVRNFYKILATPIRFLQILS